MGNTANAHKPLDQWPELTPAQASEYNYVLLVDQSGSMDQASTRLEGKTKWQEVAEFTESFARYAQQYNEDGITLIKFAAHPTVWDKVKADKVHDLFQQSKPWGGTNLGEALDKAWEKHAASTKKTIIVCVTDGAPDSTSAVEKSIINATKNIKDDTMLSYLFIQVGEDAGATQFLDHLDNSLNGAQYDIVNTLSEEEAETMTVGQLLFQAVNH